MGDNGCSSDTTDGSSSSQLSNTILQMPIWGTICGMGVKQLTTAPCAGLRQSLIVDGWWGEERRPARLGCDLDSHSMPSSRRLVSVAPWDEMEALSLQQLRSSC